MAQDERKAVARPTATAPAVVERAKERLANLFHDMIDAAVSVPDESWTEAKRKVWNDLNQPHATAPVWIRALSGPMTRVLAETAPARQGMSVTLVNLTVSSREQWEEMRDKMREEELRKMEVIEVEAADPRNPT